MAPVASSSASSLEGLGGFGSVSGWADKAFGQGLSSITKGALSSLFALVLKPVNPYDALCLLAVAILSWQQAAARNDESQICHKHQ